MKFYLAPRPVPRGFGTLTLADRVVADIMYRDWLAAVLARYVKKKLRKDGGQLLMLRLVSGTRVTVNNVFAPISIGA